MLRNGQNMLRKSQKYMLILKGKMRRDTLIIHTKSDCTQGIDQTTFQNQVYFNFSQFCEYFPGINVMRTDGHKEKFTRPIKTG